MQDSVAQEYYIPDPNLTQQGIAQAKAIRNQSVSLVLSSPMNRTIQTAQLAYPAARVIVSPLLREACSDNPCDRMRRRCEIKIDHPNVEMTEWPGKTCRLLGTYLSLLYSSEQ